MTANLPLKGKRILVTRPIHQSSQLADALRAYGAEPVELPLIRICPPDSWEPFDSAFANLEDYEWIVFASTNAVETTLERSKFLGMQNKLTNKKIACIGASTAIILDESGLKCSLTPASYVGESLLEAFPLPVQECNKILWPRTNIGRNTIKDGLEVKGWKVDVVNSYMTEGPENPLKAGADLLELLQSAKLYAITLASSETVNQLKSILQQASAEGEVSLSALLSSVKLAVIGPETARSCKLAFDRVDIQPDTFTASGLVDAIVAAANLEQIQRIEKEI